MLETVVERSGVQARGLILQKLLDQVVVDVDADHAQRLSARVREPMRDIGRPDHDLVGVGFDRLVADRNLTWPLSRMKTSGYGCTWSPAPAPGGVDTMKLVAWMPPNCAPSNRTAVGLNRKASMSITSGSFTS